MIGTTANQHLRTNDRPSAPLWPDPLNLSGARVVVVGLGRTGEALAGFLLDRGARVVVTDVQPLEKLYDRAQPLAERGAGLELGGHREKTLAEADLIVVSPGVPLTDGPLQKARSRGVPLTGEIDLAARFIHSPMVAVGGTNGKTTTTSLIGEICLSLIHI